MTLPAELDLRTLDHLSTAVMVLQAGRIQYANRAATALLGQPLQALQGQHPAALSPELQANGRRSDELAPALIAAASQGQPLDFDWRHLGTGGQVRDCRLYLGPLPGRPSWLLVELRDVSAGVRARRTAEAQLEAALEGTIQAMARTVQVRDPYTSGHQLRVAQLAEAIGEGLGLDDGRLQGLALGAIIHDLGKLYVPLDFLNRPGPLNELEMALVRQHPSIGAEMLAPVDFPWPLKTIVLQHHERLDGSGYPAGLEGDAILLESRIVAVADVVEAMASHRPYRPALGTAAALAEIRRGQGAQFDGEVVDACLAVFDAGFSWNRPSRALPPVKRPAPHGGQTG